VSSPNRLVERAAVVSGQRMYLLTAAAEARRVQMLALDLRHDAADDAGTDFRVSRKHDGDIAP
jgi:hypothetical protein